MSKLRVVFEIETETLVGCFEIAEAVGSLLKYGPFPHKKPAMIMVEDVETAAFGGFALDNRFLTKGPESS